MVTWFRQIVKRYRAMQSRKRVRMIVAQLVEIQRELMRNRTKPTMPRNPMIAAVLSDLRESEYQARARRAESLGFTDPEDVA